MINIALPKGRLGEKIYDIFEKAGYECPSIKENNRKLIFENEEKGVGAGHHNQEFDIDEDVLYKGAAASATFAIEYLKNPSLKGGRKLGYKDYLIKVDNKEILKRQYGE